MNTQSTQDEKRQRIKHLIRTYEEISRSANGQKIIVDLNHALVMKGELETIKDFQEWLDSRENTNKNFVSVGLLGVHASVKAKSFARGTPTIKTINDRLGETLVKMFVFEPTFHELHFSVSLQDLTPAQDGAIRKQLGDVARDRSQVKYKFGVKNAILYDANKTQTENDQYLIKRRATTELLIKSRSLIGDLSKFMGA
jgi:hypothetical protein